MLTYEDLPHRLNLASWFVDRNLEEGRGGRTALFGPDGATTYAELAALVNRSGHVLRELGVRAEERVLLVLSDGVEFVALWYGAQKIGAVTAEAYTFLQPKDYAYYLDYTRAGVVVVDGSTLGPVREAAESSRWLRRILVVGAGKELRGDEASFETHAAEAPDELEPAPTTRDDIALWKFTTGSTGAPKGAVHPQHTPLLSFDWYARGVLGIREDDVVLPVPKLFFGYARDLTALYPFGVGGAGIVFPERTTPERIFELVARHRPSILVQVPTMMAAMTAHQDAARQDLSCVRLCTSAGEALPAEVYERWRAAFGVEVLDGIGSSEAYHIYISSRPGRVRPGSVGEVVPGYRARVVDEGGREVPDGETGTLWIEGDTAALLYWNEHEKTKETFSGDLVKTGDLFARDADGYFWFRGRADQLLKVGGVWVAPAEVEQCLLAHPDVAECAVVGYEQEGLMRTRAHVVLRDGVAPSDELAVTLQEHVRHVLSPHKYPRDVRFVSVLPKTPSGKIDRRALVEVGEAA
ncbi:MAG TPA: benzoate-CoA ligase family protein [Gaiellaceae bacterium]|nr:benzoate-CoA ligase family protein [Gaiellaceae bacterium]